LEGSSKKGPKPFKPSRPSRPFRGPTALLYDTGSIVYIVNSRSLFTNLMTTSDFGYLQIGGGRVYPLGRGDAVF
jgi:hypothetical protein